MTRHLIRVINRKSIDDRGEIAFSLKLNLGVFNENLYLSNEGQKISVDWIK